MSRERCELLIHFGAGECREAEQHIERADLVVLVEPNAEICQVLKRRFEGQPRVNIIEASVGEGEGAREFWIRNISEFSGFCAVGGLNEYFPGLNEAERTTSLTQDAATLLANLTGGDVGRVELLIDVNGAELEVLRSLDRGGWLSKLTSVIVYCGKEPLFEGALTEADVASYLKPFGNVASRGVGHFRRVMLDVTTADLMPNAQEYGRLPADTVIEANQKKLAALEDEYQKMQRLAVETESRLREEVQTCREEILEKSTRVESLEQHNATLEDRCEDLSRQNKHLSDEEMPGLRRDLAVALRSHAMADADLRMLRTKYEEMVLAKREQEELLALLSDRLSRASAYLVNEQGDSPGPLSVERDFDSAPDAEAEALTSRDSGPEGGNAAR